nr:response regulator [Myxococcota bacterium]
MSTKVLVFENDSGFAEELRSGLGRLGCETTVVDDANVGLQTAAQQKPDLILLAIELSRMNGFSVCNKLKRDPSLKNVPLIIMSTESTDETFEQHKRLRTRADDYVHKPIGFGTLLEHIQAFVKLDGSADGAAEQESMIETDVGLGAPSVDLSDADIMSAPMPRVRSVAPQKPNHSSAAPAPDPSEVEVLQSLPPEEDAIEVAEAEVDLPPSVAPIGDNQAAEEETVARFSVSAAMFREQPESIDTPQSPEAQGPEEDTRPYASALGLIPADVLADSVPAPNLPRVSERPPRPSSVSAGPPSLRDVDNPRL